MKKIAYKKKRIGLALGSGSARGLSHIGVIRELTAKEDRNMKHQHHINTTQHDSSNRRSLNKSNGGIRVRTHQQAGQDGAYPPIPVTGSAG